MLQDIDLASLNITQGFRIIGENAGDYSGTSASSAGDVNGDGYVDLIIGAPRASVSYNVGIGNQEGISYVVFGKNGSYSDIHLNSLTPSTGFKILGVGLDAQSGTSVSGAGDFNNDGYADIIIGSPNSFLSVSGGGVSYVIFGKNGTSTNINLLDFFNNNHTINKGFMIEGTESGGLAGQIVQGVGDFNGDGNSDVLVEQGDSETAYVILGTSGAVNNIQLNGSLPLSVGFNISQPTMITFVSSAGDVNNDGFSDIIIAERFYQSNGNEVGAAHVVFGKNIGFGNINLGNLPSTDGFKIIGGLMDPIGSSVGTVGDINGDGFSDIITGSIFTGKYYVIFGKNGTFADINLQSLDPSVGFKIIGGLYGKDGTGAVANSAGDFNGDGYDDIVIGANLAAPFNRTNAGEAYVVFGKPGKQFGDIVLNNLTIPYGLKIFGANGDMLGCWASNAMDMNHDGYSDIIIGANAAYSYTTAPGQCYVIFGGPSPTPPPSLPNSSSSSSSSTASSSVQSSSALSSLSTTSSSETESSSSSTGVAHFSSATSLSDLYSLATILVAGAAALILEDYMI